MTLEELYTQLKSAYTAENLTKITTQLIALYKSKNPAAFNKIISQISQYTPITNAKISKSFSQMMMLYHPDRLPQILASIENDFQSEDHRALNAKSHILVIQNYDFSVPVVDDYDEDNLSQDFQFEDEETGYDYYSDDRDDDYEFTDFLDEDEEYTDFFTALKIKLYGHTNIELSPRLLEDLYTMEIPDFHIDEISGIEHCRHLEKLDLSNNRIIDISDLQTLELLEEVYLANNQIGYIDALGDLVNLNIIDLSNNDINDLSPLFDLPNLAFLNILSNPVSKEDINKLKKNGVLVIH